MNKVAHARVVLKTYRLKPNRSEQKLLEFLNDYFPGEFIFNDGRLLIDQKIPDFPNINKHKVILELIGRRDLPKHSEEELQEREKLFKAFGFGTLFIYQEDLKNEDKLFEDILFFLHYGYKE